VRHAQPSRENKTSPQLLDCFDYPLLLSRANVADMAGCAVFMGYKRRIVLGPLFHDAIFALAIKEAAMSSRPLVFLHRLFASFVVVSSYQRPQLSALRPGKQHRPWHVAPMVVASLSTVQLDFVPRNAVSYPFQTVQSVSTLLMSTF
jgi:hypothetical protein